RTSDLDRSNQKLQKEISERNEAEKVAQKSEQKYIHLAESIETILWEYDISEDKWIYVSPPAIKILGYAPEEWTNLKFWSDHIYEDDKAWATAYCASYTTMGEAHNFEYRFYKKNGEIIWIRDIVTVESHNGTPIKLLGFMTDITERKKAEKEVKQQLLDKEIILRETHHRIKNNFASVVSLLSLQAQSSINPEAISALQDAVGRVNSMRVLYEKLLLTDDYQVTSINEYLTNLIDDITNLFTNDDIIVEKQIDEFKLDSKQLIPIGIIVNELLTNIMKYAFTERGSGRIEIILKENQGKVVLTIQDDGKGLPEGFDISESEGFGFMLIKLLSQQLNGTFIIENNNGTKSTLVFVI
ncbi:PAS domain S-box protein, partial [bacterium]|nr:PAS domain S-box protein [bacterium]